MDNRNDYTNRPRRRVSRKMARRRQIAAVGVIFLILLLSIILLCNACSDKSDKKGNTTPSGSVTSTTTTVNPSLIFTTVATTTTPVVTADPADPNTITAITLDKYEVYLEVGEKDMPWVTMTPESSSQKGEKWESSNMSIATVDSIGNITGIAPGVCYVTVTSENNPIVYAEVKVTVISADGVPGVQGATTGSSAILPNAQITTTHTAAPLSNSPTYIQGILISNKSYGLPSDYAPGLDSTTQSQFNTLSAAAAQEGLNIWLASGYRSYANQRDIYNNYVNLYGTETADTFSARPGHSEHQTGLAIDVNSIDDSFANTPESDWLAAHAHEYGFIIRYPKGKESITGYKYEPWHLRYLGVETATAVYNSGLTLEEYLGIDSKYKD